MSDASTMKAIADLVPQGSRVLDLGCGDGALLAYLQQTRACTGYGIEIADANVLALTSVGHCLAASPDPAAEAVASLGSYSHTYADGTEGLAMFDDASFDVVLQIDTLQHLRNAEVMLRETARVGKTGIVAFPNFGHWPNRLAVLMGRMPVTKRLPYQWYDTPNIRVGTYADFEVLAQRNQLNITDSFGLQDSRLVRIAPNLMFAHFFRIVTLSDAAVQVVLVQPGERVAVQFDTQASARRRCQHTVLDG